VTSSDEKETLMPLFGPPPKPPKPPFLLGVRPFQIALGVLSGWKLRDRGTQASAPTK
jgi:hypothetical protein